MGRLCERPGCSENAALAYGMRTEELVFWVDMLRDSTTQAGGVLCQRHGDSMVVPRGWTLDDLRDPDLHLFRPPPIEPDARSPRARRDRSGNHSSDDTQQLELRGLAPADIAADDEPAPATGSVAPGSPAESPPGVGAPVSGKPDAGDRWTPTFDATDDLDGLLAARSPLLSRAFHVADRPD